VHIVVFSIFLIFFTKNCCVASRFSNVAVDGQLVDKRAQICCILLCRDVLEYGKVKCRYVHNTRYHFIVKNVINKQKTRENTRKMLSFSLKALLKKKIWNRGGTRWKKKIIINGQAQPSFILMWPRNGLLWEVLCSLWRGTPDAHLVKCAGHIFEIFSYL
jgi:hypothetical protein